MICDLPAAASVLKQAVKQHMHDHLWLDSLPVNSAQDPINYF